MGHVRFEPTIGGRSSADPNGVGGFAPKNGAGAKGEMGEGAEGIAASARGSENDGLGF